MGAWLEQLYGYFRFGFWAVLVVSFGVAVGFALDAFEMGVYV